MANFTDNELKRDDFLSLSKDDVKDLIPAIGPRNRFLKHLEVQRERLRQLELNPPFAALSNANSDDFVPESDESSSPPPVKGVRHRPFNAFADTNGVDDVSEVISRQRRSSQDVTSKPSFQLDAPQQVFDGSSASLTSPYLRTSEFRSSSDPGVLKSLNSSETSESPGVIGPAVFKSYQDPSIPLPQTFSESESQRSVSSTPMLVKSAQHGMQANLMKHRELVRHHDENLSPFTVCFFSSTLLRLRLLCCANALIC